MKRKTLILVLLVVLVALLSVSVTSAQNAPRRYIVISQIEGRLGSAAAMQSQLAGARVVRNLPQIGAAVVTSADANFVRRMNRLGYLAAPDRVVRKIRPERLERLQLSPNAAGGASNPLFPLQWNLLAVRATEGWVEGRRGAGAQVAVLDEGFYLNHPDLDNVFNTALAASFVPGETVQWMLPDGFSHGTHVSGIIAAEDNNIGTVGVAPDTQIIPVKVLSEVLGFGYDSWVIAGMLYAAEQQFDIVNMSLGGYCELTDPDCRAIRRVYNAVVRYMNQRGVTVIASAGNEEINFDDPAYDDLINLPAQANGVLSITATGPFGWAYYPAADPRRPASYSNYGKEVADFAAPGGDFAMYFVPEGQGPCTVGAITRPCWVFDMVSSPAEASSVGIFNYWAAGTSMAAPHVAGIAAQIVGANGGSMHPAQVTAQLRRYAEKLSPTSFYGKGFARAKR